MSKPSGLQGEMFARLRSRTDRRRTGEKVACPDPAAAPLGTDDEAAGDTPSADHVAAAIRSETNHPKQVAPHLGPLGSAWILLGFELGMAVLFIAAVGLIA